MEKIKPVRNRKAPPLGVVNPVYSCSMCQKLSDGSYRLCPDCRRDNSYEDGEDFGAILLG